MNTVDEKLNEKHIELLALACTTLCARKQSMPNELQLWWEQHKEAKQKIEDAAERARKDLEDKERAQLAKLKEKYESP